MWKLLFFLVFLLCLSGTLQKKGKRKNREHKNISTIIQPRVFKGIIVTETKLPLVPVINETQAPTPPPGSPPLLRLQRNSTSAYLRGSLSTRVIPIFYMLVVVVGVPANVGVLCALASKVRTVSSAILYCSLAVSDLLLLLSLFFKAHYHLHGNHWALGEAACRVVTACFYGNLYSSAQTLACISVKRYLAVVHPFMYKGLPKRTYTAWVSAAVWGVFAAAMVPELLVQQTYRLQQLNRITCHDVLPLDDTSHSFLLYYNLLLNVFGLLLPLVVSAVCYGRIICELRRSHLDWALYIKASSMVFAIFLVCFTPAGVLHFLHYLRLNVDGTEGLYMLFSAAACLCCLHSCLDPFLFLLMSRSAGSSFFYTASKGKTLSISF